MSTRHAGGADDDCFTHCLYSLTGLGTEKLRRLEFDNETFLYYAGHFAHFPRAAVSLELILGDYFALPVAVRQFCGQWLTLESGDYSLLSSRKMPAGRNNQQGVNMVVGERVWDIESKFRIRIGPLTYRQFCRFMPSGDQLTRLCLMVRSCVGPHLDLDVQLVLQAAQVPRCRLGNRAHPARLGWNTWVPSVEFVVDVDDAVFSLKGSPW
jgi:type VI secretion system protein ImpH